MSQSSSRLPSPVPAKYFNDFPPLSPNHDLSPVQCWKRQKPMHRFLQRQKAYTPSDNTQYKAHLQEVYSVTVGVGGTPSSTIMAPLMPRFYFLSSQSSIVQVSILVNGGSHVSDKAARFILLSLEDKNNNNTTTTLKTWTTLEGY